VSGRKVVRRRGQCRVPGSARGSGSRRPTRTGAALRAVVGAEVR
jgi:hypothetical protein